MTEKLTGKTRFRAGTAEHPLVLQVEYTQPKTISAFSVILEQSWRDAKVEDLCELNALAFADLKVTVQLQQSERLPGEKKPDPREIH